ncbi:outer membrane protein TolC [Pedobacter sp. AK017]|nr:outer membrane protein TolC [Pedobacter sp. AK017]
MRHLILLLICFFSLTAAAQSPGKLVRDLNFFIQQALTLNPVSRDFKNQLLMTKIDSLRLRAGYLPQVTASSTGLYAPVINGYGHDEALTNAHTFDALLTANYNLINKGLKTNGQQQLLLQMDSIKYAANRSELDLGKTIAEQYINAYASQQQVMFNLDVCNLLDREEVLLKQLTRSNAYRQTDYLTFLVTLKQQQLQLKQAELQFKNDYAVLNYLTGIKDTSTVMLKEPVFRFEGNTLTNHPFFMQGFAIDSAKNSNERKAVVLNYLPKASVYINGGYNSSFLLQPYKNFGTSAGFTLSVPIYDGRQKKMQLDKLNLQAQTTTAYRDFFINQHRQQIDMLYQQITATEGLYVQIKDQIKFARSLVEVDLKLLRTGDVKIADLVIAINNYMAAQNQFRQTDINRLKLINQLNYWNR